MLDQRRRRWADVVQMLYKCFVFAGMYPGFELCFESLAKLKEPQLMTSINVVNKTDRTQLCKWIFFYEGL